MLPDGCMTRLPTTGALSFIKYRFEPFSHAGDGDVLTRSLYGGILPVGALKAIRCGELGRAARATSFAASRPSSSGSVRKATSTPLPHRSARPANQAKLPNSK